MPSISIRHIHFCSAAANQPLHNIAAGQFSSFINQKSLVTFITQIQMLLLAAVGYFSFF
jgi:hypothetical protein